MCATMKVLVHLRLSEFCLKSMLIALLPDRNTHAQTFLLSRLVNLLVHGTCLD